jgi:hypothetical protein
MIPQSVAGDAAVAISDLDAAAEVAGVERPSDANPEQVQEYVSAVAGLGESSAGSAHALWPTIIAELSIDAVDAFDEEHGWSVADVFWFAEVSAGPGFYTVLGGDFEVDDLDAAMGERVDDVWHVGPEGDVEEGQGDTTMNLAFADDRLIVAYQADEVRAGFADDEPTLADDESLRKVAKAMDDAGAYSACFVAGRSLEDSPILGDDSTGAMREAMAEWVLPEEFSDLAVGVAENDGESSITLAYAHENDDAAEGNAAAAERILAEGMSISGRPWSELVSLEEIATDDATLVLTLRPNGSWAGSLCSVATEDLISVHQ